jgi:hypothetical protein
MAKSTPSNGELRYILHFTLIEKRFLLEQVTRQESELTLLRLHDAERIRLLAELETLKVELEAARSRFQVDWTEGTYEPPKTYRGSVARKKREEARAAREKEREEFRNRPRLVFCEECGQPRPPNQSEMSPEERAREAADLAEAHAQIGKILAALGVSEDQQKELSKKVRI